MAIKNNKVIIATPMYGGMCTCTYTLGLIDTFKSLAENDYAPGILITANESLITRGRNDLVHRFLQTDAHYFLFVDADIGFKGEDVLKLINAGKDLICGLYPKKIIDWERITKAAQAGETNLKDFAGSFVVNPVKNYDPTDLDKPLDSPVVEIDHAGTGFMLITRTVFETLAPHVKEYRHTTFTDKHGNLPDLIKEYFALDVVGDDKYFLSEDYFFCDLWRKHGGKVYADLSISLTHTGTYTYTGNVFVGGSNRGG